MLWCDEKGDGQLSGETVNTQKKKPVKKAVALEYRPSEHAAPVVTAKGRGFVAEKIIALAKKEHIPIKDDPDLVEVLSQVDLDEQIPPSVYQVVAEIFSFIYQLNKRYQGEKRPDKDVRRQEAGARHA